MIHGYPTRYNAGSEIYSQTICHELSKQGHEVKVFSRREDPFYPDGHVIKEKDPYDKCIQVILTNNPNHKDRYKLEVINHVFEKELLDFKPDIVHIGHLNHLSTSIIEVAKRNNVPIVYTLHDYWLMCPRGQFMQMHCDDDNLWNACSGQENSKCAKRCYARYFSGDKEELEIDMKYWENWVDRRMVHIKKMLELVDLFISPAKYLKERYERDFGLPKEKSMYLDYGFNKSYLKARNRRKGEEITFGYIGTHIPAKGIQHLILAFGKVRGDAKLKIWGRDRGQPTSSLKALVDQLPTDKKKSVIWMHEYENKNIVEQVFNEIDVTVVPSIWVENSPLVIHESQQLKVPVITADAGGMSEYVNHKINGLLFKHRDLEDLAIQMQYILDHPEKIKEFGEKGYLYSKDSEIHDITQHVKDLVKKYEELFHD